MGRAAARERVRTPRPRTSRTGPGPPRASLDRSRRSEEHTSELQSQSNLVCRLLLEKKKIGSSRTISSTEFFFESIAPATTSRVNVRLTTLRSHMAPLWRRLQNRQLVVLHGRDVRS